MTNQEIFSVAQKQSAIDLTCDPQDFLRQENVLVHSAPHPDARRYLTLPFSANLVSYGNNIVASVDPAVEEAVRRYIDRYPTEHCFETPNLHVLSEALAPFDLQICFMAEYFLPDLNILRPLDCPYETRLLHPEDFTDLYRPEWSNALCETRKHLDVLGVGAYDNGKLIGLGIGAYDNGKLIGLAGCSADCDEMWQIGIDVLPEYRKQGIASALTSQLACEIMKRGKVPFYCAAWSNLKSVRNAIRSGFRPAWVEMTAKPRSFVEGMNRSE